VPYVEHNHQTLVCSLRQQRRLTADSARITTRKPVIQEQLAQRWKHTNNYPKLSYINDYETHQKTHPAASQQLSRVILHRSRPSFPGLHKEHHHLVFSSAGFGLSSRFFPSSNAPFLNEWIVLLSCAPPAPSASCGVCLN
jgi:hypothetical protein